MNYYCLKCGLPGMRGITHACLVGFGSQTWNPAGVASLSWTVDGTFWLEMTPAERRSEATSTASGAPSCSEGDR